MTKIIAKKTLTKSQKKKDENYECKERNGKAGGGVGPLPPLGLPHLPQFGQKLIATASKVDMI